MRVGLRRGGANFMRGRIDKAADPAAMVIAALVGAASALGWFDRAGLTPDQVAELLSALLALAAAGRMIWRARTSADHDQNASPGAQIPDTGDR